MSTIKRKNIFLIGPMGAGKTTIGRQLSTALGVEFLDSDKEIEDRCGAEISWIFDVEGEAGFRSREKKMIDELTQIDGLVLATGGGSVIADENRNNLAARGVVVYLETSVDQQLERTLKDKTRPLLQVDDPREKLQSLMDIREPLYKEIADICVVTDKRTTKAVTKDILDFMEKGE